ARPVRRRDCGAEGRAGDLGGNLAPGNAVLQAAAFAVVEPLATALVIIVPGGVECDDRGHNYRGNQPLILATRIVVHRMLPHFGGCSFQASVTYLWKTSRPFFTKELGLGLLFSFSSMSRS